MLLALQDSSAPKSAKESTAALGILAPAYDMLPMAFAPVNHEVIERPFPIAQPRTDTLAFWEWGQELEGRYWQRVCADERLSDGFRETILGQNGIQQ